MKNIILIGMAGCGKTTCGGLLSRQIGWELADTDDLIVKRAGRSIPEIFARDGEAVFRDLELEACRDLSGREELVIACGGGLPVRPEAIRLLKSGGTVFWLNRDPGEIYDTLDRSSRPLAQSGRDAFLELAASREPVYRRWADFVLEGASGPEEFVERILAIWEREESIP